MEIALYICPFILFSLGLALFLINPSKGSAIKIAGPVFFAALVLSFLIAGLSNSTYRDMRKLEKQIGHLQDWKDQQIAVLSGLIAQLRPDALDNAFRFEHFTSFGWDIKNVNLIRSLTAEKLRQQIIDKLPKDHFAATSVIIKGLPEDIDQSIVKFSLEELGFTVDLPEPPPEEIADNSEIGSESAEKTSPDESSSPSPPLTEQKESDHKKGIATLKAKESEEETKETQRANVMLYGSHVKSYEIKLIALTLMRAGVNIRQIKAAKNQSKRMKRTVSFEWIEAARARPIIEPVDVYSQTSFRRK